MVAREKQTRSVNKLIGIRHRVTQLIAKVTPGNKQINEVIDQGTATRQCEDKQARPETKGDWYSECGHSPAGSLRFAC